MKLIVGLGNPGTKYARTRHNIGFMVIDQLAKDLKLTWKPNRTFGADIAKGDDVVLLKPQTFINKSGAAVQKMMKKLNLAPTDSLIVLDDLDMEVGKLRYRAEGSSGGHRGMQSIIDHLQTNTIPRLKIGIGRSATQDPEQYVLSNFTALELPQIKTAIPEAVEIIKNQFLG